MKKIQYFSKLRDTQPLTYFLGDVYLRFEIVDVLFFSTETIDRHETTSPLNVLLYRLPLVIVYDQGFGCQQRETL